VKYCSNPIIIEKKTEVLWNCWNIYFSNIDGLLGKGLLEMFKLGGSS